METYPPTCVSKLHLYKSNLVESNTPLANILEKAKTLNTHDRAELLESSDELDSAHTSFAQQGQSHTRIGRFCRESLRRSRETCQSKNGQDDDLRT